MAGKGKGAAAAAAATAPKTAAFRDKNKPDQVRSSNMVAAKGKSNFILLCFIRFT